jgi:adenylate cyclase
MALLLLSALGLWWEINRKVMEPLEKERIAVLPFVDLSTKANQAYLADGILEELIAQLSQIPDLAVIPRTSVLQYKGSLKDVTTIGRELGVGAIVEGSIRNLDKQVRVSVQLIDVASQGHLWSNDYTRKFAGAAITQSDIATRLAQGLRGQLTAQSIYNRLEGEPRFTRLVQTMGHGK